MYIINGFFAFYDFKFYSVSRSAQFKNDYARDSLGDVFYPDEITSNKEYEKLKKQTKLVTEHYNAYKANYSGNVGFDLDYGSKNFMS